MSEKKYGKYIVTGLTLPESVTATRPAELDKSETIVSWIDGDVVPGASHMACIWYFKATPENEYPAHTHESNELIGFFGSDYRNPHKLGGEIEFWIEDEQFIIDESCLIFVPAGVKHCPLRIRELTSPIFHFTSLSDGLYVKNDTDDQV